MTATPRKPRTIYRVQHATYTLTRQPDGSLRPSRDGGWQTIVQTPYRKVAERHYDRWDPDFRLIETPEAELIAKRQEAERVARRLERGRS